MLSTLLAPFSFFDLVFFLLSGISMLDNVLITQMGIRRETMPFSQSYLLIPPLPRIRNRLATALFVFIKLLLPIKRIWCEFVTYKSVANGLARNVDANVLLNICVMNDIRNMMIYRLTNTTTTTTNNDRS